jgi:hypothetical protein
MSVAVMDLVRARIRDALELHPRVVYQELFADDGARAALAANVPLLVPFVGETYHDVLALVDWDHRLPSRTLVLRLYGYYHGSGATAGRAAYQRRRQEIAKRERFPEFDVPDLEGLVADEAYEAVLTREGRVERMRLVSAWRREIDPELADLCVALTRASTLFHAVDAGAARSDGLGDLEAVSWCPPCESAHHRWTIDVWYLTDYDGLVGKGYSFVVDPVDRQVITARDFLVRAQGAG